MKSAMIIGAVALSLGLGSAGLAQAPKKDEAADHRPPPGMCRIWVDGVPASQQPAPTDCATAVRNRPEHGRVIFGSEAGHDKNLVQPRSFTETLRPNPGQRSEPDQKKRDHGPPARAPEQQSKTPPRQRDSANTKPDGR